MVITKREDVTKQGFCKLPLLEENSVFGEVSLYWYLFNFNLIVTQVGGDGRLLTFSAFRMGAYSRWALI